MINLFIGWFRGAIPLYEEMLFKILLEFYNQLDESQTEQSKRMKKEAQERKVAGTMLALNWLIWGL